jgi:hypothetical protein
VSNLKRIYRLEIIGGLALVQKEIEADYVKVKEDSTKYVFMENLDDNGSSRDDKVLAYYPSVNTIIASIEDNPDYLPLNRRGNNNIENADDYDMGALDLEDEPFVADLDALDALMRPTPPDNRRYDDQGDELIGQL